MNTPRVEIERPDLESLTGADDHQALRIWTRMTTCCNLIEQDIRSRLRSQYDTTLPRFGLMAQLHRQPAGMKMSDLSRHLMVTNGNVTGITDQLEKEGLVERVRVETDRRSSLIRLTAKGRRSFSKMAASYEEWVKQAFSGMDEARRDALFDILGELKTLTQAQLSRRA